MHYDLTFAFHRGPNFQRNILGKISLNTNLISGPILLAKLVWLEQVNVFEMWTALFIGKA